MGKAETTERWWHLTQDGWVQTYVEQHPGAVMTLVHRVTDYDNAYSFHHEWEVVSQAPGAGALVAKYGEKPEVLKPKWKKRG